MNNVRNMMAPLAFVATFLTTEAMINPDLISETQANQNQLSVAPLDQNTN